MQSKSYSSITVQRFLRRLQGTDPKLAAFLSSRLQESGLAGFWDDLGTTLKQGLVDATQVYRDKEIAKLRAKEAARIAKEEAAQVQREIELARQRAQSQREQLALQREQAELQKFIKNIELDRWQKIGLGVAGVLALGLVANRAGWI